MSAKKIENQLRFANTELNSRIALLEGTLVEKEKAAVALQGSEKRYRRLFESAKDGILILDVDTGKVVDVNPFMTRLLGYPYDTFCGKYIWEIGVFKDIAASKEAFQTLQDHEYVRYEDLPLKTRNGQRVDVEFVSNVYQEDNNRVIQCNIRDITERKRDDAMLKRMMAAIEQVGEIVIVTDIDGTIQYVNPAFEAVTGYTREEAVGKSPRILKSDKQDPGFYRDMWETISSGKTWSGRIVNKRKDGRLYTEEATISPVRTASGAIVNYVAVKRDITDHLRLTSQFQQAQKMETVGTLAGGIAHDFNNILTAIIGFGELLKRRVAKDPKALSDLDQILHSAERASVLTRQLLIFARRQVIDLGNIDLNRVVIDLEKLLRKVTRADIEIKTFLAENLPTIQADQGQVEQVLMNLSLNARDAMLRGGQLVVETQEARLDDEYVKQYPYMKAGRYAVLAVSDTGIGMDEETRERIFEPFFTTKGPDKGSGLGLAVVYGIVKQHGGFIHVYSEPGKGTTFRVYFPTVDAPPDSKVAAVRAIIRGGSETILLAEDDEAVRHLTEKTLSAYGYRVLVACNGEEAVDIFRRHNKEIAMALLDMVMPKKGGMQAYEEMVKTNPGLKRLFMSGYSPDAIHDSFVLHPGTPFLQKPFGPGNLARRVREVLDGE